MGESNNENGKANDEKKIVRISTVIHVLFVLIHQALGTLRSET